MRDCYDIAIVGAGPAGAMAAYACAKRGVTVLLLDKARFPRSKVCGGCFGSEALGVLERAGLASLPGQIGARPLHGLRLVAGGRAADLPLSTGTAISREAFDHALISEAMTAGAAFVDGITTSLETKVEGAADHTLSLRCEGKQSNVRARVVLIADGIAGTCLAEHRAFAWQVARRARLGFGTVVQGPIAGYGPGVIHMGVGSCGYVGVVGVEGGQLDVAAAADAPFVRSRGGPAKAVARLLDEAGLPPLNDLSQAKWRGTPWLTRHRRCVSGPGLFVIGDAAGYVEPFTGEGIGWALQSAETVAPLAVKAVKDRSTAIARQWEQAHHRLFAARHRRCRFIAAGLRRPRLVHSLTALLGYHPPLARPFTRWLAVGMSLQ